ncbi:hypothetical protein SAMN05192558_11524 [Actinokineospora alba]|uniref:Uncharacterized protein n=1 Tax=Actinokineospora alba TaxID=504798 RepID=A0A1H0VQV8_9PSEU|nr:hypothetical protein [Actinokineospora alba]TDP70174.1 hypothetical protein C8E96_5776 [Actinokineospora alba]SDI37458.1 hypothetical protein SAMN05421871_104375 [Actinokineospora alba]SDP80565.1 hypothetical protein SAMN05192558_11524 [Actinokineospora alba]
MTTVEDRPPTTTVLVWTALLLLPAIAVPLRVLPMTSYGRPIPWFTVVAGAVAALAALAVVWRWPDKGWRWTVLIGCLLGLSSGALLFVTAADLDVMGTVATASAMTVLVGTLGTAGWLAQAGWRALAAVVAGLAVLTSQIGHVTRAIELLPQWGLPALFAVTGAASLAAVILLGLGADYRSAGTRMSGRVILTAAVAALIPVAFAVTSWLRPQGKSEGGEAFLDRVREIGLVAVVIVAVIAALAVWAGPRPALGVLSLGALTAGSYQLTAYAAFIASGERVPELRFVREPGLGTTTWLLILAGLAVGVAFALPGIRGYLGAAAALAAALSLYLADSHGATSPLWPQVAVAALVAAVVAGVAAVCDGPSAAAVGITGFLLGGALARVDGLWTLSFSDPVYTKDFVNWMPVALMGAAAVGLAVFTYLGLRAQRHDSATTATPMPVDA